MVEGIQSWIGPNLLIISPLSRDSGFNVAAWGEGLGSRKGSNGLLVGWLAETWPPLDEAEMLEQLRHTAEEGRGRYSKEYLWGVRKVVVDLSCKTCSSAPGGLP